MEALQIKKPALSVVWHDKHTVKAPSAHTVGNYIISPQLSNGDGVSKRARYTERDRWTSHVATESLQPYWSNAGRVPLFTGVVVISPGLKCFLLLLFWNALNSDRLENVLVQTNWKVCVGCTFSEHKEIWGGTTCATWDNRDDSH